MESEFCIYLISSCRRVGTNKVESYVFRFWNRRRWSPARRQMAQLNSDFQFYLDLSLCPYNQSPDD
jgi:hypothetical protein